MGAYEAEAMLCFGVAFIALVVWTLLNAKIYGGEGLKPEYKELLEVDSFHPNHSSRAIPPPVNTEGERLMAKEIVRMTTEYSDGTVIVLSADGSVERRDTDENKRD